MSDAAWGGLIMVYVLAALPLLSMQASEKDSQPKDGLSRGTKWGLAWAVGLALILLAWKLR